jgi:hypothetical protein
VRRCAVGSNSTLFMCSFLKSLMARFREFVNIWTLMVSTKWSLEPMQCRASSFEATRSSCSSTVESNFRKIGFCRSARHRFSPTVTKDTHYKFLPTDFCVNVCSVTVESRGLDVRSHYFAYVVGSTTDDWAQAIYFVVCSELRSLVGPSDCFAALRRPSR